MTLPFSLSAALRRRAVGAAALALVLGLGACATTGPQTPEDEVRARATGRWNALIAKDRERADQYLALTVRANLSLERFREAHGDTLAKAVRVREIECESATCTVRVALDAESFIPGTRGTMLTTVHQETWVRQDGQWWFNLGG